MTVDYSPWDEDGDLGADESGAEPGVGSGAGSDAAPDGAGAAPVLLAVAAADHGERLDKWLARTCPEHSRSRLQGWIEEGAVRVNGQPARVRQPVQAGDQVEVRPRRAPEALAFRPEPVPLAVVYEDADLIVLDKPAGLVVHPAAGNWSGTLLNGLLHRWPELVRLPRAGIVHRLDKDTSGLMVVARTAVAQTDLVRQLQARTVRREYLAVVYGWPAEAGEVDAPIGRDPRERTRMAAFKTLGPQCKPARTHYRVLDRCVLPLDPARPEGATASFALVACTLETGRTHQIRVHMHAIGHALVGDPLYRAGGRGSGHALVRDFVRQALHVRRLGLVHPRTGRPCLWRSPPPRDFLELLERLGLQLPGASTGPEDGGR